MTPYQGSVTQSGVLSAIVSVLLASSTVLTLPKLPRALASTSLVRHAPGEVAREPVRHETPVIVKTAIYSLSSDFVITAQPTTRTYDFTISTATGAPDGYVREMTVINGQFPGPPIEVNEGDTIIVNVHNTLSNGTGIHWHGIRQNGTNWADGVPGITQCPIPANSMFTYRFTVTGQQGTYWYHAHVGNTLADGLLGPIIIHSPSDPYARGRDYDCEEIITLNDWMHDSSEKIIAGLLGTSGYLDTFAPPVPDSLLMNGIGIYNCNTTTDFCETQTIPDVLVIPNKKYRFRIINLSSHVHYNFSIDQHPLNVIAADGNPIVAVPGVHQLPISIAQRYDIIVDTSVGADGSAYYIRAAMCSATIPYVPSDFNIFTLAALRYVAEGSTPTHTPPTSVDWADSVDNASECTDFPDSNLVPYEHEDAPTDILDTAFLSSATGTISDEDGNTFFRFFWNSVTWTNYIYRPMLFIIWNGGSLDRSAITHHVFTKLGGADIVVNNLDPGIDHSYHLHGRPFYIVARGRGTVTSATYSSLKFSPTNPPRRDTLIIPRSSYAVLRLLTDTPGVFGFHCHFGWHLAAGKMAVIVIRPDVIKTQHMPPSALALCDASNIPAGENRNTTAPGKKRADDDPRRDISVGAD